MGASPPLKLGIVFHAERPWPELVLGQLVGKPEVDGFVLAAEKEQAKGQTYIFAGERPVSITKLVMEISCVAGVNPWPLKIPALPIQLLGSFTETICKPFGIEPILHRRRVDFFTKTRSFDTSKAKKELGYSPRLSFEAEVEKIFGWYKANGWLD